MDLISELWLLFTAFIQPNVLLGLTHQTHGSHSTCWHHRRLHALSSDQKSCHWWEWCSLSMSVSFLTLVFLGKYALCHRPTSSEVAENQVQVNDVVILSAAQIIKMGTANSEELINTFICGRHQDYWHICLDLELDHMPLTSKDLDVVVDIDSLIWVTLSLHFHTCLAVYLGPMFGGQGSHAQEHSCIHRHSCTSISGGCGCHWRSYKVGDHVLSFRWNSSHRQEQSCMCRHSRTTISEGCKCHWRLYRVDDNVLFFMWNSSHCLWHLE